MRKVLFAIIFIVLFTVACSHERQITKLEGVRLFSAINGDVQYSEHLFTGDEAQLFAEVARSECPQGTGTEFVRAEVKARSSSLIIYTDKSGKNVTCSILKPTDVKQPVVKTQAEAPSEDVAVVVNGQQITIEQVRAALAQSPAPRDESTVNLVLNNLINQELLRQEALKVDVSDAEVAAMRAEALAAANLTEAELPARLERQGWNMSGFEASVKEQAQMRKLLDERLLLKELKIDDATAREYYLQNPNAFLRSEQAVMRDIFISSSGRTQAQVQARAQQVAAKLNNTDFCELVQQYSDDNQSAQNCGVYIIPRGVIDPNLELASFTTPVNQTSVVATSAGIHFVQTLQVTQAQVVPYSQVATGLQQDLKNTVFQQRLNLYLQTLRSQADIVSYLG